MGSESREDESRGETEILQHVKRERERRVIFTIKLK